jgi:mono/diheme cytochrome c family protein
MALVEHGVIALSRQPIQESEESMETFHGKLLRSISLSVFAMVASLCQAQGSGKDTFTAKCVMCHAADGTGSPTGKALKAPNIRTALIQKRSDAEFTQVISQGKANMPAFGTALSEDEIKDVIAYVRMLAPKKK